MNKQTSFFYPHFFMCFKIESILFHNHLEFFQDLFHFLIVEKNYFFYNPSYVIHQINILLYKYIVQSMNLSPIKSYFFGVLTFLEKNKHFSQKIYIYLIELCSLVFFLSIYNIAVIEFSAIPFDEKNNIDKINSICQKYNIKAKKIIILENKNLLKGIKIFVKNIHIDRSLKMILNQIEKEIIK